VRVERYSQQSSSPTGASAGRRLLLTCRKHAFVRGRDAVEGRRAVHELVIAGRITLVGVVGSRQIVHAGAAGRRHLATETSVREKADIAGRSAARRGVRRGRRSRCAADGQGCHGSNGQCLESDSGPAVESGRQLAVAGRRVTLSWISGSLAPPGRPRCRRNPPVLIQKRLPGPCGEHGTAVQSVNVSRAIKWGAGKTEGVTWVRH
jgi:hypothetical protein